MIATIRTANPQQFQFRAMISGLHVDEVEQGVFDVTYRDSRKVLGVIREAGGTIIGNTARKPLTPKERFSK